MVSPLGVLVDIQSENDRRPQLWAREGDALREPLLIRRVFTDTSRVDRAGQFKESTSAGDSRGKSPVRRRFRSYLA